MAGAETLSPQMQRDGVAVPENIANQPRLKLGLLGYMEAFHDLTTERPQPLMRIPWSKVVAYAKHYEMNEDETLHFIKKMDDAYLAHHSRKTPDGGSSGPRTVVQRPPRPD